MEITRKKIVFFDGFCLDDLAFRSYEIHLLSKFAAEYRLRSMSGKTSWDSDCDAVLAHLITQSGYSNVQATARHAVWHILTTSPEESKAAG